MPVFTKLAKVIHFTKVNKERSVIEKGDALIFSSVLKYARRKKKEMTGCHYKKRQRRGGMEKGGKRRSQRVPTN